MGLKLPGDESVGCADEVEDLDDLAIARHRAARGEPDRRANGHDISANRAAARITTALAIVPSRAAQMRWSSRSACGTAEASA